ncbi:LacI family DNA-binding transcriptional regulator [Rhizobium herbae]|uniref:DNA-binding LacI/PurR family transcriptional regulator n=1 Tax=Rhizobium herbae TaxID=508661 RepID=A0ABS4EKJ6_9HYPH|nr:LacI family DNA-binding transcriptional regulator [Rhizobium herbae]MBP1858473.1 DNA-binding LacI/PurR family transcriptional regulator [Rhizobium herbae]
MIKGNVKLADVAKAAGVSQGTASNVFSRPEVVRQEVRERVLGIARELGYNGPDIKGRLLRAGRVNAIGVAAIEPLAYFFEDPWARALMTEIAAVCDATGTGIALVSAQNQQKLAWNINSALVDGFILLCVEGGEKLVELTRRRQLPFIALALGSGNASIPAIGIDNIAGAATAARHLADLGHRRFAILAIGLNDDRVGVVTPEQAVRSLKFTSRDRALGYWQALADFGIGREDVPMYGTQNDRPSVNAALEALFSTAKPPRAILAMSDRIALLAMQWLAGRGLAVPGDVSVIGFDGVPEAATAAPGLTTMAQPLEEIARRAVAAILDEAVPPLQEALEVMLVVRGSTAPPRSD